jgi:UDP-galactopyranose mutase
LSISLIFVPSIYTNTYQQTAKPPFPTIQNNSIVIIGAGLSGATLAQRLAEFTDCQIVVIDKKDHVAGNAYDYIDPTSGIRINKYGPHFFHSNNFYVWSHLKRFAHWSIYEPKALVHARNKLVPFPINLNSINILQDTNADIHTKDDLELWLPRLSKRHDLDMRIANKHAIKLWKKLASQIDPLHPNPSYRTNFDGRYYTDTIQGIPNDGYTALVQNMLNNTNITVVLQTDYDAIKEKIPETSKVIFTGPIDSYFSGKPDKDNAVTGSDKDNVKLEPLQKQHIKYTVNVIDTAGYIQSVPIIIDPTEMNNYTKSVEYKHFTTGLENDNGKGKSVLVKEKECDYKGDISIPIDTPQNLELYATYQKMVADSETNKRYYYLGRTAPLKYFHMDEAVSQALSLADELIGRRICDIEIVVNHYKEDANTLWDLLTKVRSRLECLDAPVTIYNKGDQVLESPLQNIKIVPLPNIGREGHTYLHHISTQYGKMKRHVLFTQSAMSRLPLAYRAITELFTSKTGFLPLREWMKCIECVSGPNWMTENVDSVFAMLKNRIPTDSVQFTPTGQFIVSSERIHRIPVGQYKKVKEMFEVDESSDFYTSDRNIHGQGKSRPSNPVFGHSIERSWALMFDCVKDKSVVGKCAGDGFFTDADCYCSD